MAYIEHADLMPILESFPLLEEFHVRGNVEDAYEKIFPTAVRPFRHAALRKLVFESGGLAPALVRAIGDCGASAAAPPDGAGGWP